MSEEVWIFGKDTCPFTRAAREAYANSKKQVRYHNVAKDREQLEVMLKHTKGSRRVPVIIDAGKVMIGFEGKT